MKRRLRKIRSKYLNKSCVSFFFTNPISIRWLTGFSGSYSALLVSQSDVHFFTDFRYIERARSEVKEARIRMVRNGFFDELKKLPRETLGETMAFESDHLTFEQYKKLCKTIPYVKLEGVSEATSFFSRIKDAAEINKIEKAVELADNVLSIIIPIIRPGIRERDIASEIDYLLKKKGGEGPGFGSIVASGPNSSMPHAVPTSRRIQKGDLVLMDFGAVYRGYHSDMTRTVVVGKPTRKQKNVYETVLKAQKNAIKTAKAGISCKYLDSLARKIIDEKYRGTFGHSLGHGVGLSIHEEPRLSIRNTEHLSQGMTVTIEPGIYIEQWGGIRIEDVVVIEKNGARVSTSSPKDELIVL